MAEIGAFEVRIHLLRLLRRVAADERFVIMRYYRPVAELISFRTRPSGKVRSAIESLKAFQNDLQPRRAVVAPPGGRGAQVSMAFVLGCSVAIPLRLMRRWFALALLRRRWRIVTRGPVRELRRYP